MKPTAKPQIDAPQRDQNFTSTGRYVFVLGVTFEGLLLTLTNGRPREPPVASLHSSRQLLRKCHAVGKHYLKYSWEYFMQTNIHNIFLYCGHPNILGNFRVFVLQNQLGENYLTYSHIWGPQNTLGKKMHYIFGVYTGPSKQIMYARISARMVILKHSFV